MGARRALAPALTRRQSRPESLQGPSVRWVVTIDKLKRRLTTDPPASARQAAEARGDAQTSRLPLSNWSLTTTQCPMAIRLQAKRPTSRRHGAGGAEAHAKGMWRPAIKLNHPCILPFRRVYTWVASRVFIQNSGKASEVPAGQAKMQAV